MNKFKLVIIETPFAGAERENIQFARECMRDSLMRGEAPFASHLLYTQPSILNDDLPPERKIGIDAGLAWGELAECTVVYTDRGISPGMEYGIKRAEKVGRKIEYRKLK